MRKCERESSLREKYRRKEIEGKVEKKYNELKKHNFSLSSVVSIGSQTVLINLGHAAVDWTREGQTPQ